VQQGHEQRDQGDGAHPEPDERHLAALGGGPVRLGDGRQVGAGGVGGGAQQVDLAGHGREPQVGVALDRAGRAGGERRRPHAVGGRHGRGAEARLEVGPLLVGGLVVELPQPHVLAGPQAHQPLVGPGGEAAGRERGDQQALLQRHVVDGLGQGVVGRPVRHQVGVGDVVGAAAGGQQPVDQGGVAVEGGGGVDAAVLDVGAQRAEPVHGARRRHPGAALVVGLAQAVEHHVGLAPLERQLAGEAGVVRRRHPGDGQAALLGQLERRRAVQQGVGHVAGGGPAVRRRLRRPADRQARQDGQRQQRDREQCQELRADRRAPASRHQRHPRRSLPSGRRRACCQWWRPVKGTAWR
jgi:hypothetical protein